MTSTVSFSTEPPGEQGGSALCRIEGILDFTTASQAHASVGALVKEHKSLIIDLSGIKSSNSAGLALMIDWLAIARNSDHKVTFSHIPDSLSQLADVCQVDGLIQ